MTPTTFQRIRKERLQLTQKELAPLLRVSWRTVQKYEQGSRPISGPVSYLMELLDEGVI